MKTQVSMLAAKIQAELHQVREIIVNDLKAQSEHMKRSLEDIAKGPVRTSILEMANRGWFISMNMTLPMISKISEAFRMEAPERMDDTLASFFQKEADSIEQSLIEQHPARVKVLQSVFRAHREGAYELSIPVFLAQADGIWTERVGRMLFGKKNGRPTSKEALAFSPDDYFLETSLAPVLDGMAVAAGKKERTRYPDVLNRHEILHGMSAGYGTKINSLKAMSLLNYVATVDLPDLKSKRAALPASQEKPPSY